MTNSIHRSEKEAKNYLLELVKKLQLKNYNIDTGVIRQKDCLVLIKENEQGEPIRAIDCAEY